MKGLMFLLVTVVVGLVLYLTRNALPAFIFILLYVFFALLYGSRRLPRLRGLLYNASFLFLALALGETWMTITTWRDDRYFDGPHIEAAVDHDAVRGYAVPRRAAVYHDVQRTKDGRLIYDATYTVDANGLRAVPTDKSGPPVFFFGDSLMFGEGVQDNETLPYRFSEKTDRRAVNFGLHGYGPHQMLRMLEVGMPTGMTAARPDLVVYMPIMAQIDRAAGGAQWDQSSAYYKVVDGRAVYAGTIAENREVPRYVTQFLAHCRLWTHLLWPATLGWFDRTADRDRFVAIVERSRELVAKRWGARFLVVVWDVGPWQGRVQDEDADYVSRELERRGVEVLRLSERLPELKSTRYYIARNGHPNAQAYALVADLLARFEGRGTHTASLESGLRARPGAPPTSTR